MKRSGILLAVMLSACAVNPSSDDPSAAEENAAVVLTLYQDTEWLQGASKDKRIQLYRQLDRSVTPCLGLRQSLQLALLLGGMEPSLTDYQRTRQVLQACLAQAQEPLLNTYIRIRLDDLERNQQAHARLKRVSRQLRASQRTVKELRNQVATLEQKSEVLAEQSEALAEQIEAVADIEQEIQERVQQ